jgi:hypothetical protein
MINVSLLIYYLLIVLMLKPVCNYQMIRLVTMILGMMEASFKSNVAMFCFLGIQKMRLTVILIAILTVGARAQQYTQYNMYPQERCQGQRKRQHN